MERVERLLLCDGGGGRTVPLQLPLTLLFHVHTPVVLLSPPPPTSSFGIRIVILTSGGGGGGGV